MMKKISVLALALLGAVSGVAHAQQPAAPAVAMSPAQVKTIGERVKQDLAQKSIAQIVADLKKEGLSATNIATALLLAGVDTATAQSTLVASGVASQAEASAVMAVASVEASQISNPTAAGPASGGAAGVPTGAPATVNSGSSFGGGGGGSSRS